MTTNWKKRALDAEAEVAHRVNDRAELVGSHKAREEYHDRERSRMIREIDMWKVHAIALGKVFSIMIQDRV